MPPGTAREIVVTQVTRSAYAASIAAKAADNSTGDITPQDLRELLTDLADSTLWPGEDAGNVEDGDYGDVTVASGVWTIDAGAVTLAKISGSALEGDGAKLVTTDGSLTPGVLLTVDANGKVVEASGATIGTIPEKTAPVAADKLVGADSEASNDAAIFTFGTLTNYVQANASLAAARITSGMLADARISESSVTQHAAAAATAANAVRSLVAGITGADAITNIVSLTQAEYDAIGTPNASTLYVITA